MGGGEKPDDFVYTGGGEYWSECPVKGCLFVSEKFISRQIAKMDLDNHECYFTNPQK